MTGFVFICLLFGILAYGNARHEYKATRWEAVKIGLLLSVTWVFVLPLIVIKFLIKEGVFEISDQVTTEPVNLLSDEEKQIYIWKENPGGYFCKSCDAPHQRGHYQGCAASDIQTKEKNDAAT